MDEELKDSAVEGNSEQAESLEPNPKKKRSHKKHWIVLGTVAVIIIGLGIGGLVWHEQPGFCSAICHEPMDSYVSGYYSGDNSLLVTAHAEAGEECLDCHKTDLGQQISELGVYISGDYTTPLPMTKTGTREFCGECHDSEEIKTKTENYGGSKRNPHDSHYGDSIECYSCHRAHRESTMYCSECHKDITSPNGWKS